MVKNIKASHVALYLQSVKKHFAESKKTNKIGKEQKTLISPFSQDLTTIAKNLFLEKRLDTSLCFHSISRFYFHYLVSFSFLSCSATRETTRIQTLVYQISGVVLLLLANND